MKTPGATILAILAVLPAASAFHQPAAVRYNNVKVSPFAKNAMPTFSTPVRSPSTSLVMASEAASEDAGEESSGIGSKIFNAYVKTASVATTLFPLWTVIFSAAALKSPASFAWFTTEYFTAALAALMLSMGITLTPQDFIDVMKEPVSVAMQFTLCYAMMPALALGLGKLFGLDSAMLAGMVLVGSINGGQASNLCTYIARGNVALSVLMTTATTLGAIFMTPLICKTLLGAVVPVDAVGIAFSTIQVVLAPIAIGMATNKFFPNFVKKILPITPVVGVLSTCLLVASAVAQVNGPILNAGLQLQFPIFLLHLIGGLVGYFLPKLTGFSEIESRTMAIETSMKSSAFGFLLAKLHFGQYAARVPSAVSVVWMALTGSLLAVIWRYIPVGDEKK
jgi:BASS family bile acid:Na+ symporter